MKETTIFLVILNLKAPRFPGGGGLTSLGRCALKDFLRRFVELFQFSSFCGLDIRNECTKIVLSGHLAFLARKEVDVLNSLVSKLDPYTNECCLQYSTHGNLTIS